MGQLYDLCLWLQTGIHTRWLLSCWLLSPFVWQSKGKEVSAPDWIVRYCMFEKSWGILAEYRCTKGTHLAWALVLWQRCVFYSQKGTQWATPHSPEELVELPKLHLHFSTLGVAECSWAAEKENEQHRAISLSDCCESSLWKATSLRSLQGRGMGIAWGMWTHTVNGRLTWQNWISKINHRQALECGLEI